MCPTSVTVLWCNALDRPLSTRMVSVPQNGTPEGPVLMSAAVGLTRLDTSADGPCRGKQVGGEGKSGSRHGVLLVSRAGWEQISWMIAVVSYAAQPRNLHLQGRGRDEHSTDDKAQADDASDRRRRTRHHLQSTGRRFCHLAAHTKNALPLRIAAKTPRPLHTALHMNILYPGVILGTPLVDHGSPSCVSGQGQSLPTMLWRFACKKKRLDVCCART